MPGEFAFPPLEVSHTGKVARSKALDSSHLVIRARGRFARVDLREAWRYRDLARALAARDITLRYRQTVIGIIWVVLQPLLGALIFAFVFGRVARLKSEGVPYVVFALCGLLAWNLFSSILTRASISLTAAGAMVSKVYFPRLLLPVSAVGSCLVDFVAALVMMVIFMLGYGVGPGLSVLLMPVWIVLVVWLALGVGLVTSALTVRYRDVQNILPVITQLLLYGSPVAYALNAVPSSVRGLVTVNPLTGLLEAFRWSLLGVGRLDVGAVAWSAGVSAVALIVGATAFASLERDFADVI